MRFFLFGFQNSLGNNKQGNALRQLWGTFISYQEADINLRSNLVQAQILSFYIPYFMAMGGRSASRTGHSTDG